MAAAAARRLPAGVFYLLGGTRQSSMNVWQVSRTGTITELTHNPAGLGIEEMSASAPGIAVGDGINNGEQDGMVTAHGVTWLHPWHRPETLIYGFGIRITATGRVVYLLAPGQGTDPSSKTFTYWAKPSPTGRERKIYSSRRFIGGPLPGPHGQIAIVGPSGPTAPGQKPGIVIISKTGRVHKVDPHFKEMSYPVIWGDTAPALAITLASGPARLVYPNGHQTALPAGWQPWSWNPAGTQLLMIKGTEIGIWSPGRPAHVQQITRLNRGFNTANVNWLTRPAKL
jgi:hypothetical protein